MTSRPCYERGRRSWTSSCADISLMRGSIGRMEMESASPTTGWLGRLAGLSTQKKAPRAKVRLDDSNTALEVVDSRRTIRASTDYNGDESGHRAERVGCHMAPALRGL